MNGLLKASCRGLMFHPPPRSSRTLFREDERNLMARSLSGELIHCQLSYPYESPCSWNSYRQTASVVIFMHGNADDVASSQTYCEWLANELGTNVVSFDYPGYGFSSGSKNTSEEGMVEAAEVALELVTNRLGCDISQVVLFGKSIGSFPAVSLAARPYCARIRGLVLVSPVASAARCVFDASFVPGFLMQRLDSVALNNLAEIRKVQSLVLFVHGRQDTLVPCDNSEVLQQAASYHSQHPALYVDAGHNDIECRHQTLFLNTLRSFVQTCMTELHDKTGASPYEFMHFEGGSG
jgi:pimeloyl-ACP methyl ester carboxylesterase